MKRRFLGIVAILLSPLFFACMSLVLNLFGPEFPLAELHFLRPFVSAMFLLPFVLFIEPHTLKPTKTDVKDYLLMGLSLAISIMTFNIAMVSAPIGTMTFLANSSIFIVLAFSFLFLREKATWREVAAILVALVGIAVINPLEPVRAFGASMMFVSAFTFAILIILIRRKEYNHRAGITFWYMLFAALFLLPFSITTGFVHLLDYFWLVLLLGLFNALGYLTKTYALKCETANLTQAAALIISPIAATLLGFVFLGQSLMLNVIVGGVIIIAAGLMVSKEFLG
ncbi:MAG: DMT family transporter [Candidatus Diapherotrites archaeon]|nr:DMT family transporter [Candidatus Diapherotrites archaeon]